MSKKNHVFATLGEQNYFTQIISENQVFYVDEPESAGGKNKAAHPTAYLLGALASCTAITIRMYAQRKGWEVGQIKVDAKKVIKVTSERKETKIVKQITFGNQDLTEKEIKRLVMVAEKCPVSLLLKNETKMESEVVDQLDEAIVKEYSNNDINAVWKPNLCQHSKKCWKELITVFNPQKTPWINMEGADSERIIEQINKCPSGALSFYENENKEEN